MTPRPPLQPTAGFALAELLVAMLITLLAMSAVVAVVNPTGSAFQTQPEAADVEQRLRASAEPLYEDVMAAGAGPAVVTGAGNSTVEYGSILPMRVGRRSADVPGTFDPGRIAMWYVEPNAPQAALAGPLASATGVASVSLGPGCAAGDASCGFRAGMLVAAFGPSAAWDLFSVAAVQGTALTLQHNLADAVWVHPAGLTTLAAVVARTYLLKNDQAGNPQLVRYDAAAGADAPVAEHIAGLRFEYAGDPDPPSVVPGTGGTEPLRVTYGPWPPDVGVQQSAYAAGENCAFARTAAGTVVPRLAQLASGPGLVPLTAPMLTDGPWCPDSSSPNRYDADLLRVRQVTMTIVVESVVTALRGPAGPLFTRGGTARGTRLVPDRTVRLVVAPRALNVGR